MRSAKMTVAAVAAAWAAGAAAVRAGSAQTSLSVQATLVDTCLVSAAALSFPAYDPGNGAVVASSTISVRCTSGARYGVGLSAGGTAGTTYTQRLLANGSSTLQYNLYTTNAYNTVWGDGSGSTQIVSGLATGFGNPVALTVYGQVPDSAANQSVVPGTYSDTIIVVLTY